MNKLLLLLGVSLAFELAGCGDKNKPTGASRASTATQKQGDKSPTLPSIANHINEYQVFDYGREVDYGAFMDYRKSFMRMAASDAKYDPKKFTEMALLNVGAETDAFKRDDLVKQSAGTIAEIKKNAIARAFINDSSAQVMTANISAYDMEKESYVVTLQVDSFSIGYGWKDKSTNYDYRLTMDAPSISRINRCFECPKTVDVVVKIPKEKARKIEELLSQFREPSSHSAHIPVGYYVSINQIEDTSIWNSATIRVNLDAVALRLPNQPIGSPLILIDGPELVPKA